MARVLRDQIVTGTSIDRHNESLTEEALRSVLEQMPNEFLLNDNHDLAKPPIGRAFNPRLVTGEDGELAIIIDIEVLREKEFSERRGLSISLTSTAPVVSRPGTKLMPQILFDPNEFDGSAVMDLIEDAPADDSYGFALVERRQKFLTGHEIDFVMHVLEHDVAPDVWHGFWIGVGGWLFGRLRGARRARPTAGAASPGRIDVLIQRHRGVQVLLRPEEGVSGAQLAEVDLDALVNEATSLVATTLILRVVADARADGRTELALIVQTDGTTAVVAHD